MADSVQLTDGSALLLDRENWKGLASQECDNLNATGRNVTPRLVAMKHLDGRVVVYATVKDGVRTSPAGGEVLDSPNPPALAGALGKLAAQFTRGPFLLKHCLSQINGLPVA